MSDEDLANWGINRSDLLPWPPGNEREDSGISFLSSERPSVAEARAIEARTRAASRERRRQQVQAQDDAERDFASTFPIPELDNNAAIGGSNFVPAADSVAATLSRQEEAMHYQRRRGNCSMYLSLVRWHFPEHFR